MILDATKKPFTTMLKLNKLRRNKIFSILRKAYNNKDKPSVNIMVLKGNKK